MGKRNTRRLRMQSNAWMLQKSTILTYISETAPPKKGDLLSIGLMQTGQLQELGFSLFIQLEDIYIYFFYSSLPKCNTTSNMLVNGQKNKALLFVFKAEFSSSFWRAATPKPCAALIMPAGQECRGIISQGHSHSQAKCKNICV